MNTTKSGAVMEKDQLSNIDTLLSNESFALFIEEKLKYIPQSDFMYNKKIPAKGELCKFSKKQIIKFIDGLIDKNYHLAKENEQFRTKNFKQYLQLKKLGAG